MTAFLYLLCGFLLAGLGGEAFVRGSVSLAKRMRISTAIIGVTIAAFATSSPELSVAINASLAGAPQIALGDALGSNVINIALILGLALCFGPMPARRAEIARDWLIVLLTPLAVLLFACDGIITRYEGAIMLGTFLVWLAFTIHYARKTRADSPAHQSMESLHRTAFYCVAGMAMLVGAGLLIVAGANQIGVLFGIPPFIVGATLVAVGTSMPELATTLIARWRGHNDLGLGTIYGSNIFNVFVIIAIAALIHPISVQPQTLAVVLSLCVVTTLVTWPTKDGVIPRRRAIVLLVLYVVYTALTLYGGQNH